jgi:hypothetical protein
MEVDERSGAGEFVLVAGDGGGDLGFALGGVADDGGTRGGGVGVGEAQDAGHGCGMCRWRARVGWGLLRDSQVGAA